MGEGIPRFLSLSASVCACVVVGSRGLGITLHLTDTDLRLVSTAELKRRIGRLPHLFIFLFVFTTSPFAVILLPISCCCFIHYSFFHSLTFDRSRFSDTDPLSPWREINTVTTHVQFPVSRRLPRSQTIAYLSYTNSRHRQAT